MEYREFLESRRHLKMNKGFKPLFIAEGVSDGHV
jgi:hypothetical protein